MKGHMEHTGRDPAAFTLKRKDYGIHWTRGWAGTQVTFYEMKRKTPGAHTWIEPTSFSQYELLCWLSYHDFKQECVTFPECGPHWYKAHCGKKWIITINSMLSGPLSPWNGTSPGCGWRRQPPDMEDSHIYWICSCGWPTRGGPLACYQMMCRALNLDGFFWTTYSMENEYQIWSTEC
jgi:hypothetical protein